MTIKNNDCYRVTCKIQRGVKEKYHTPEMLWGYLEHPWRHKSTEVPGC